MRRHVLVLGLLATAATNAVEAQATAPATATSNPAQSDWLVAGSIGLPGNGTHVEPLLFTVGVNWTKVRPGRLGADFSLGTMPWALAHGAIALGARGGVALPIAVSPNTLVLPSAGLSVVGAATEDFAAWVPGFNAGFAAVFHGKGSVGVRTGITMHLLGDGPIWLFEIGPASLPHRVR